MSRRRKLHKSDEDALRHIEVALSMQREMLQRHYWAGRMGNPPLRSPIQKLVLILVADMSWGPGQDAASLEEIAREALLPQDELLRTLDQLEKLGLVEHYESEGDDGTTRPAGTDLYYLSLKYQDDD